MQPRPPIQQSLTTFPHYWSHDVMAYLISMQTLHIYSQLNSPNHCFKGQISKQLSKLAAACVSLFRPAALFKWIIMSRMNEVGTFWKPRQNYHAEWLWTLSWLSSAWPILSATSSGTLSCNLAINALRHLWGNCASMHGLLHILIKHNKIVYEASHSFIAFP